MRQGPEKTQNRKGHGLYAEEAEEGYILQILCEGREEDRRGAQRSGSVAYGTYRNERREIRQLPFAPFLAGFGKAEKEKDLPHEGDGCEGRPETQGSQQNRV